MEYDFFISYRWATYTAEAQELANLAQERGYRVWIDRENPPLEQSDAYLEQYLSHAISLSRYVLFFETVKRLELVKGGTAVVGEGWQPWELRQANPTRLVVLYHSHHRMGFGINRNLCPYSSLADALRMTEAAISDPDLFTSQRSPCPVTGAEQQDASALLKEMAARNRAEREGQKRLRMRGASRDPATGT